MREESKSYAREAMDIVEHAAHKIGSRLPGSDGEIKFHQYMGDKLRDIGIEPKTEEFAVSPRSGIGGLSYAGWSGPGCAGSHYDLLAGDELLFLQDLVRYVLPPGDQP